MDTRPHGVPGYWNNEAATARELSGGNWHSGDIGSMDEAGFVRIFDRKKEVINRGGHKVYAAEVENVLLGFEELAEAAVVATPCAVLGERVHAFLIAREGRMLEEAAIREVCAALLADYKVLESFTWLSRSLPLKRERHGAETRVACHRGIDLSITEHSGLAGQRR